MKTNSNTMFVTVDEVMNDLNCSRSKAYAVIRDLSRQLKKENPKILTMAGRINRIYYEECCMKR